MLYPNNVFHSIFFKCNHNLQVYKKDTIKELEYCSLNKISEILVLSKTRSTPALTYLPDDIIETRAEPTTCYNPSLYILRLEIYLLTWTSTVHPGKDKPGRLGKDKWFLHHKIWIHLCHHHCSTQLQSGSIQSAPADVGDANLITWRSNKSVRGTSTPSDIYLAN